MTVYAIGDLQGCLDPLERLLEKTGYDPAVDSLWFTGDLVNRGPQSLATLRYVMNLGDSTSIVLGNHDLHLLAIAYGNASAHKKDTLDDILEAPDREDLLTWLRYRPLLHHDPETGFILVHAGLAPNWSLADATTLASELESVLRGDTYAEFFREMYGNKPDTWHHSLQGMDRLRFAVNCFTRMRVCTADGSLDFKFKGVPGEQPDGYLPWFELNHKLLDTHKVIFGHWSAAGARQYGNAFALDSGCIWGNSLTALKLGEEPEWISVGCG